MSMSTATPKDRPLTHDEIWDDSSLISAWDDALAEYQKYHSVRATGDDLKTLVQEAAESEMRDAHEAAEERDKGTTTTYEPEGEEEEQEGEVAVAGPSTEPQKEVQMDTNSKSAGGNVVQPQPDTHMQQPLHPQPPMPQNFTIGGNNEAMRNVMMSWYWAGYYTGLYEGQQQAAAGTKDTTDG